MMEDLNGYVYATVVILKSFFKINYLENPLHCRDIFKEMNRIYDAGIKK